MLDTNASPLKCLDLDDTSGQFKQDSWQLAFSLFIPFSMSRYHITGNFGEDPFLLPI